MRDLSKAMKERYEQLLTEAADDERIFTVKLSEATRRRRYWERLIAEIKADVEENAA